MMNYKFKCLKCETTKEIEMRMSEYTDKGHYCNCGNELVRDISDICSNFDTSKISGFFGKSDN